MKRNFGIFSAMLLGGAFVAQASEGVNVGGYVDGQYNYASIKNYRGTVGNGGEVMSNSFRFAEAAIWATKKAGGAEGVLDLDIKGPSQAYTRGFQTGNTNTAWTLGGSNSQAYVAMTYDNGFTWRLGQFDSLYGYEPVKSSDRHYAQAGLLSALAPTSHVGWHGKYEFSDMMALNIVIANPHDVGVMKNGNLNYGLKLNTKFDSLAFNLGALFKTGDQYATGAKKQLGYFVDWDVGSTMGSLEWALYGYVAKGDVKGAKTDFGAGLNTHYAMSEMTHLGLRFEYDKDGTKNTAAITSGTTLTGANATSDTSSWAVTVGPQFHMTDAFTTKLDYTYTAIKYEGSGAKDHAGHAANLAGVYKF